MTPPLANTRGQLLHFVAPFVPCLDEWNQIAPVRREGSSRHSEGRARSESRATSPRAPAVQEVSIRGRLTLRAGRLAAEANTRMVSSARRASKSA